MKLLDMLLGRLSKWTADAPVVAKAPAKSRTSDEAKMRRKAYKKRKAAKAARRRNRR